MPALADLHLQLPSRLSLSREAYVLALALLSVYLLRGVWLFLQRFRSPLRHLRGPERESLVWGNLKSLIKDDTITERWAERYGATYRMPAIFAKWRLNTIDPRAVAHILSHTETYSKPDHIRVMLGGVLGEGLLIAEGEVHKRQRRIMNPSFSPGQIREVTPIFFETGAQLRDVLNSILSKSPSPDGVEIDVYSWVGRAALDIIGQAGFGYHFNALYDESNELFRAFHAMFEAMGQAQVIGLLRNRFRILRLITTKRDKIMKASLNTTNRIGMELVRAKKAAVQQEMRLSSSKAEEGVEKSKIVGRDLLSALIRANMAADLSPAHRMSDEEVLAQISTFIVAGHETTAAGLTWTLYSLAQNPAVQDKLRAELSLVEDEAPNMDDLNALPYLDMVVKEALRFHSPVHGSLRQVQHHDTIPLSHPVVDAYGKTHDTVRVQAGDFVGIEIMVMNRSKALWGEDAGEFRPERWAEELGGANEIPGIYAHTLTFIGGPRACIGYRFSIIETKALLFTLIREFQFAAVPGKVIKNKNVIVARPYVDGELDTGFHLPMIVSRVSKA
ncbi:cytochrome P450 [Calocera cornea HHB12733]|uniref:Cytochrome P450 n=1 Tax=Calocera cornea HHB12733 TaxID=1353952 RepID=A0A165J7F0_9BASI|nr:cytochrome P450 [Calocera cornea HHB12733]